MSGYDMTAAEYRRLMAMPASVQGESIEYKGPTHRMAPIIGTISKPHHALGRLPAGEMNKTEARFEREVLIPAKAAGDLTWYAFNAVKFRIAAHRCWLTIDFFARLADGSYEAIDVKGAKAITEEDAKVKMKVAASAFPFTFKFAFPRPRKLGGGWLIEEVRT
jgi:hypothetical protein